MPAPLQVAPDHSALKGIWNRGPALSGGTLETVFLIAIDAALGSVGFAIQFRSYLLDCVSESPGLGLRLQVLSF